MSRPKKPKKSNTADRHRSGFMIRLPEEYRPALRDLTGTSRRSLTGEVMFALDRHLKAEGKEPPVIG